LFELTFAISTIQDGISFSDIEVKKYLQLVSKLHLAVARLQPRPTWISLALGSQSQF